MSFTFDLAKDRINQVKHGISLAEAANIDWDETQFTIDTDHDELREIGTGPIGDRLYVVVFMDRGDVRRVISLRRATKSEVKIYAENY